MKKHQPKILFVTPILQFPAIGGPALRIENSIKALARISELHIYSRSFLDNMGGQDALSFYEQYCKHLYFAPFTKAHTTIPGLLKRIVNLFSRLIANRNLFVIHKESKRDFQHILKIADTISADVIWLGFGNISYFLLKFIKENSTYKVVVDTDSVWSRFVLRGLPYVKNDEEREKIEVEGKAKGEEEKWGTRLADVTTAVSEIDREYYQCLVEDKNHIMLFSNVIDLNSYKERPIGGDMKRPAVYLAGTFWKGSPMEEAARWMIEKVMPAVWTVYPSLHFYILGNNSKETLEDIKDMRISILGRVPSVLPYLCNVDIAVVPLKFESGTRFKILEAGACGIPIVSTTLGAEGIPVMHNKNILIADTPSDFAASIIRLLENKHQAKKLASNCRELIAANYDISTAVNEAKKILSYLLRYIN